MTHTPGPWIHQYLPHLGECLRTTERSLQPIGVQGQPRPPMEPAIVATHMRAEDATEAARRYNAFPHLLAALEAAKIYVDIYFQDRKKRVPVQETIDAAIAAAKGE